MMYFSLYLDKLDLRLTMSKQRLNVILTLCFEENWLTTEMEFEDVIKTLFENKIRRKRMQLIVLICWIFNVLFFFIEESVRFTIGWVYRFVKEDDRLKNGLVREKNISSEKNDPTGDKNLNNPWPETRACRSPKIHGQPSRKVPVSRRLNLLRIESIFSISIPVNN